MVPTDENDQESDVIVHEGKPEVRVPGKYAVWLHNDDYTTMEFVLEILDLVFQKTGEEAVQLMLKVHQEGRAIAGLYSREIAEMKVDQVLEAAQGAHFPLVCTMEPMS